LLAVEICGVLGRLHSNQGLAQSNNNAKLNYSAKHKIMLMATRANYGWEQTAATQKYRGSGAIVCRKLPVPVHCLHKIFDFFGAITWSNPTYIEFFECFPAKK
jgi:hypothetical protein